MKKLIALVLAFVCLIGLASCNGIRQDTQEKLLATYSFSGENDLFGISNGVIVLGEDKDIFRGGKLEIIQNEPFTNVAAFRVIFYTVRDNKKSTIITDGATFNTDIVGYPSLYDDYLLSETSGKDFLFGSKGESKVESLDDLINNFWVELKVVDLEGKESIYQLQLTVTEVVS